MSTPEIHKESVAPLVQRILADPLHFRPAKQQERQTERPVRYTIVGGKQQEQQDKSQRKENESKTLEKKMAVHRPTSLAQAIAGYTGKRSSEDLQQQKPNNDQHNNKNNNQGNGKSSNLFKSKKAKRNSGTAALLLEAEDELEDYGEEFDGDEEEEEEEEEEDDDEEEEEEEEEDSSYDENDYTDAESSSPDFVSKTPRNIVSTKVFEQFQSEKSSSASEDDASAKNDDDNKNDDDQVNDNDDDNDDDEDDEDYVEAVVKDDSDLESTPSESAKDDDEEDYDSSDSAVDLLKIEKYKEDDPLAPGSTVNTTTPPTSPESEDEVAPPSQEKTPQAQSSFTISDFYQINEIKNDKGSNNSKRISKNWDSELYGNKPAGLLNHGVTCYTNAAVQAMIHIPAVQHYLNEILKNKYSKTVSPRSVSHVLAETSARMWGLDNKRGSPKYINPKKLISRLEDINCMMSEFQQEDSHEYFMSLLSRLQEDSTPKGHKLNESIIYDIFGGLLNQSVTCKNCGAISKTQQEFYDLSLHLGASRKNSDIPPNQEQLNAEQEKPPKHRFSIVKSIKDFFSPELIKTDRSDKSGYVCEKCKQTTNAIKISSIDRAPETLAVHLKRFRFNGTSSSKVKQAVSYPAILDLSPYTTKKEPVLYQLISVVVHEGRSVSSGHYIAHCRQPDGTWGSYDDEYINIIPEKEVLKDASAYYLIYTRLTHKDLVSNPVENVISKTPRSSVSSSSSASASKSTNTYRPEAKESSPKQETEELPIDEVKSNGNTKTSQNVGIIKPSSPKKHLSRSKTKFSAMKPTNNLGNITGKKQKRYNSKNQGSKRFKRY